MMEALIVHRELWEDFFDEKFIAISNREFIAAIWMEMFGVFIFKKIALVFQHTL